MEDKSSSSTILFLAAIKYAFSSLVNVDPTAGIKRPKNEKKIPTVLIKQDEDPDHFQVPGTRFSKYFTDKKTNDLIIQEFMNRCYKTEDDKPCKTVFFCVNVKKFFTSS